MEEKNKNIVASSQQETVLFQDVCSIIARKSEHVCSQS